MMCFALVVTGANGDIVKCRELFLQTAKLVKRKTNNLEKFCSRRVSFYFVCMCMCVHAVPLSGNLIPVHVTHRYSCLVYTQLFISIERVPACAKLNRVLLL